MSMKKALLSLLLAVLLISIPFAHVEAMKLKLETIDTFEFDIPPYEYAEAPDLASFSTADLFQLQNAIIQEIGSRKELPSFTAPIGIYEAGKDFPAGKYIIAPAPYVTYIDVYENRQMFADGIRIGHQDTLFEENGDRKMIELLEGMIVDVSIGNAHFEPYLGLVFE